MFYCGFKTQHLRDGEKAAALSVARLSLLGTRSEVVDIRLFPQNRGLYIVFLFHISFGYCITDTLILISASLGLCKRPGSYEMGRHK